MEKTPKTFYKFKEGELRDVILALLNGLYIGEATAEAWSKLGRTDITLVIPEGAILVIECKLWNGPSYYGKAIDQLFNYLTWHENYGFLVTFCKKGDFSKILERAEETTINHSTYIPNSWQLFKKSKTHSVSNHQFPENSKKEVKVHHLFFNLIVPN